MPLTGTAAARLFDDHVDAVHTLLARRVGAHRAPDLAGEVFEQAALGWDRFQSSGGTERLYLVGLACGAIDRHPKSERDFLVALRPPAGGTATGDPLVADGADGATLPVADETASGWLLGLSSEGRNVVLLSQWEAMSNGSIAEALGVGTGADRSSLSSARKSDKDSFIRVETLRPMPPPISANDRRMVRERLFGVGPGDATGSITGRADSGAVTATAPYGTRVGGRPPAQRRSGSTVGGSWAKAAAGLLLAGGLVAIGWSFLSRDDGEDEAVIETTTTTTATPTTPPTLPPPPLPPVVRTGVDRARPIVLPLDALPVDEAEISAPAAGSSSLLLRAPDGSTLWMAELDGDAADFSGLEVITAGSLEIGVPSDDSGGAPSYQLRAPCGLLLMIDAPDAEPFRPAVANLLSATSVDVAGVIDMTLPTGWDVIAVGPNRNRYVAVFQVGTEEAPAAIRLEQIPGGTLADLAFGNRQLVDAEFLGKPAFVDAQPFVPDLTSVYFQDGDTVFTLSSTDVDLVGLGEFVESLEPVTAVEFTLRYQAAVPPEPVVESDCAPQPSFGPTLSP